jgi:oligosaccharide amylase
MRDLPVGNGRLLVNFDHQYQIRDIYFPHVGQENHTEGFPFRFGIWANGEFSWVLSDGWRRDLRYLPETLVTDVHLTNERLGLEIVCNDTVASHDNIFLRKCRVHNLRDEALEVRVFLHHDFRIYENKIGDTAFYDPESGGLIHYKKHRYFLISTEPHFDNFSTGRKAFHDKEGTWRDAEDGVLSGGAITEGSVDSTIRVRLEIDANASGSFFYWIAAGDSYEQVVHLNSHVHERRAQDYLDYTANYWRAWVNKNDDDLSDVPTKLADFYRRSLLVVHTQSDADGAILAANDSDVTERASDHYSYLWTRDGAFVANALDLAGFAHLGRLFFQFAAEIVHPNGYFLQKYNADGTVASGWHASWDVEGSRRLVPIQEDETALVLWALWNHYDQYRDIEFGHRLYRRLVVRCADFMAAFRDEESGLPHPSWNLWEDRRGVHTFTCATVVAGLRAAANFARLFAERTRAEHYEAAADGIVAAMEIHLYSSEHGRFLRSLQYVSDGVLVPDPTVDASLFGLFYFGCFSAEDERGRQTMAAVEERLASGGGIARFENDGYMHQGGSHTGNAWFICTLWLADYYIATARSRADLERVVEIMTWVIERALPSGVLAEQFDPQAAEPVSVSPLTWSHATFIATFVNYLKKLRSFSA